jgi:hypothetical protein
METLLHFGVSPYFPLKLVSPYGWHRNLAAAENADFAKERDKLRDRLTAGQIAEAQKLATEYSTPSAKTLRLIMWPDNEERPSGGK